jgi:branched-chain amino acid transport system ATP-binding protein
MPELLRIEALSSGYGESVVVDGVSLAVDAGECVALLGRNGVGKTTLLTTIMGLTQYHGGAIRWQGVEISQLEAHKRAVAGLGWVPQERRMWKSLSVLEHLTCVARPGPWTIRKVQQLFPRLAERGHHHGAQLSGGEQQMLATARALVTNPKLLLLDEPMEGLAPIVVQELTEVLRDLAKDGAMAVILVEQHAELALGLAPRAVVMERGRVVHEGPSEALLRNREQLDRWLAVS